MSELKFTVIRGGAEAPSVRSKKRFLSAYVTDTRLMGVVGMCIHWELTDLPPGSGDFYQFFYYDAEEYGWETYTELLDAQKEQILETEQSLLGGLGGKKIPLTEKEARWLVRYFYDGSLRLKTPVPEPKKRYGFLLQNPITLSPEEEEIVILKMCTPLLSDYHVVHYFLMRVFARDLQARDYLTAQPLDTDEIFGGTPATLCQNSISEFTDETGALSYLCESLIETDNLYKIITCEITTADRKITSAQLRSSFRITPAEATLMLNRPEFVTVYEILTDADTFDREFSPITLGMLATNHENGRLFLQFNLNNDHVNRRIFRLNEDIHGMFFVSECGQLIAAAYGLNEIHDMELILHKSVLAPCLLLSARYEFKEPVLYEFVQSDFDDFSEFLDSLQNPE